MKHTRPLISASELDKVIKDNTYWSDYRAKEVIQSVQNYIDDSKKERRLEDKECKPCFYFARGRLGGAALTTANCEICGKETMYGSTNTDRNCGEHNLCVRCTGKLSDWP